MALYKSVIDMIGNTPLLEVCNIEKKYGLKARLIVKLEGLNPAGSIKDRVAKQMILDALECGKITKDTVIIEPTSGNTGIGLASVCASLALKLIIVMPNSMSVERIKMMKAYGAEVVLTDGSLGMKGAIAKAKELASTFTNSFIPSQFDNLSNPKAHLLTTGKEIYDDLDGQIDAFVAGVGTGGTITGVGKYLKEKNDKIKVFAVEPLSSPVLSSGKSGKHEIQGIGAGFVPNVLDTSIYDKVFPVSNEDAFYYAKEMGMLEGILVGISSGAALSCAISLAKLDEYKDKTIVCLLPDNGDRYVSTKLFE